MIFVLERATEAILFITCFHHYRKLVSCVMVDA